MAAQLAMAFGGSLEWTFLSTGVVNQDINPPHDSSIHCIQDDLLMLLSSIIVPPSHD